MIDLDVLQKKEKILDKIADLLAVNFLWESNKGIVEEHKNDIKSLLIQYYDIIQDKEI